MSRKLTRIWLVGIGLALAGYFGLSWISAAPEHAEVMMHEDGHFQCDRSSDGFVEALVGAFDGTGNVTNRFMEMPSQCPHDAHAVQLAWAIEVGFPRRPLDRALSAKYLATSFYPQDAQFSALALALLAFESRVCGSTDILIERLKLVDISDERVVVAVRDAMKRKGGENVGCDPLNPRSD
ncbi:MAG: hypothetical protein IPK27_19920 [Rhodanobacteraceae bacterium]|nr:hypothetical protein [Rhodanobacteraceae bacterium]